MDYDALERRARLARSRALVRRWEYRQRDHAKGVWFRLARLLAGAREVWAISEEQAERLRNQGFRPESVGEELWPPKAIFVVSADRLEEGRALPVRIGPEFLAARNIALVPFDSGCRSPAP